MSQLRCTYWIQQSRNAGLGMTDDDIKTKRREKTEDLVAQFGDFDNATLAQLKAAELNQRRPRAGLVESIDEELAARSAPPVSEDPQTVSKAAKPARGEVPAWQRPEYDGPLTCDQAYWRNTQLVTK